MKKGLLTMAAVLMLTTAAQAGRVVTDSLHSEVLGEWVKYNVYLPNGYEQTTATSRTHRDIIPWFICSTDSQTTIRHGATEARCRGWPTS